MKRANKKPDAILCSDFHLREDQPICRIDNYWDKQASKIQFIRELQKQYECPVLVSGDIFNKWKPSPFLLSWAIEYLPDNMIVIPGQHDLAQHNIELLNKTGLFVLEKADKIKILSEGEVINIDYGVCIYGYPFGSELQEINEENPSIKIAMCHTLTWVETLPYPGCILSDGGKLLKKLKGFNLVLVGDNHQSFIVEKDNRILISPGSMMRMTADQVDHTPRVYLWYKETNTVEPVYLPIEQGVISREHIAHIEERDGRIDAFISKLDDDWKASVSFEENLERFAKTNQVRKSVMEIVYKSIE